MKDRSAIELFLDQVFNTTPVVHPDYYIASAVAQARRSLNHQESRALPPPSYELPSWLRPETLGPYETTLLANLLFSPGPIIVFRGGTGSGKSSVLGYLCRHVAECSQALTTPLDSSFRSFLIQIDVQTFGLAQACSKRKTRHRTAPGSDRARAIESVE